MAILPTKALTPARALGLALGVVALSGCGPITHGEMEGVLIHAAKQGLIVQTWEGQVVRIGASEDGPSRMRFTIENEATAKELAQLAETKTEIRVHYRKRPSWVLDSGSDGVFLVGYESLSEFKSPTSHVALDDPAETTNADAALQSGGDGAGETVAFD